MRIAGTFEADGVSKTANFTAADDFVYLCDATSGAIAVTLPAVAAEVVNTRFYLFVKTDSSINAITVDASGAELINGATTYDLASQYQYVWLYCDGAKWFVVGAG